MVGGLGGSSVAAGGRSGGRSAGSGGVGMWDARRLGGARRSSGTCRREWAGRPQVARDIAASVPRFAPGVHTGPLAVGSIGPAGSRAVVACTRLLGSLVCCHGSEPGVRAWRQQQANWRFSDRCSSCACAAALRGQRWSRLLAERSRLGSCRSRARRGRSGGRRRGASSGSAPAVFNRSRRPRALRLDRGLPASTVAPAAPVTQWSCGTHVYIE